MQRKVGKDNIVRFQAQFYIGEKRTTIRFGAVTATAAKELEQHINHLIQSKKHGTSVRESTLAWLQSTDKQLLRKLHTLGLCKKLVNPTVVEFVEEFMAGKKSRVAERTITAFKMVQSHLKEFFPSHRLSEVDASDAKAFADWLLLKKGLSQNTAGRRLGRVREIFNQAQELGLVNKNPFKNRAVSVAVGAAAKTYVDVQAIQQVIDYCADFEWKLLFALARYVGVRVPSEIVDLQWTDVNWERNTILIRSPKTACKGKPARLVPILAEIAPILMTLQERQPTKSQFVFQRLRSNTNLSTSAKRFVERAGLVSWDKFWNSLRASAETDLMDKLGIRRACQILGNTPRIAMANYALQKSSDFADLGVQSDAKSDAIAPNCKGSQAIALASLYAKNIKNPNDLRAKIAGAGLEPARALLLTGF